MGGLNWRFICLAIHISAHLNSVNSLTCLSCDSVAHPRLCTHVTKCFPGEKCGMDTFISQDGDLQYRLGCVDTNTCSTNLVNAMADGHQYFSCHRCCDDHDLCNVRGCNSTGFPTNRGPICYDCEAFPEGYPCHKITHCETHEVCYNEAHLEFQSDILYSSGCRSKHHCAGDKLDPMAGIGRRSVSVCTDCCQGDLCNIQCRKSSFCSDDSTCQLLMASYDVCKSPDIAKQFCQKSCNLCATSGITCTDTRLDCAYIANSVNMCGTLQAATNYGCLKYCGYCSGSTGGPGSMYSTYTTSSGSSTTNLPSTTTLPQTMIFNTSPSTDFTTSTTAATNTVPPPRNGDHVIRGPDWHYGNQDGNGIGTIIDANLPNGWVQVYWANTGNAESYRYGTGGIYEVQKYTGPYPSTVQTTTTTTVHTTFAPATLVVGEKVVRGPDWTWQTQDSNGTGTVVSAPSGGWVRIKWDKTGLENSYRYGDSGKYDVKSYPMGKSTTASPTTVTPSPSTTAPPLSIGDVVVRGPDWNWQSQDGNGTGTVIDVPMAGWVVVRWNKTGVDNAYRYGESGAYDVKLYSVGSSTTTTSRPTTQTSNRQTTGSTTMQVTTTNIHVFRIGDRVVRGPDWRWGDQDNNGIGTVIGVDVHGWVTVRWDNNFENFYRNGVQNAYDLQKVGSTGGTTTSKPPTTPPTAGPGLVNAMYVGARVQRGIDWRYGTQDGNGPGTVRALPPKVPSGWVQVEWDNGYLNNYRIGIDNAYDVMLVPGSYNPPTSG